MKLIVRKTDDWVTAVMIAKKFLQEYPDRRVGFYHGVLYYSGGFGKPYYVYKTKTATVVTGGIDE
jgi:hypothetical protein